MIGGLVARHTVTIQRAPLADDGRGNTEHDWDAATEHESHGWAIDAGATVEDETNREGAATEYTLRGPFGADVRHTDRAVLFGLTYLITGGVLRQPGPTPATSHTIIRLTRWEG